MLRNDYRRALIMLRSLEQGYAGHARLERRTLMGTLCFTASAPGASMLRAALVGRRGNDYFAAPLGTMRRDSRGQYGLICSFDPRNIEGKELEEYQMAVIVAGEGNCRLVLSGNVNGSTAMDWESVRAAACALFANNTAGSETPPAGAADENTAQNGETGAAENGYTGWTEQPAADATEESGYTGWADQPAADATEESGYTGWTEQPAADATEESGATGWADQPAVDLAEESGGAGWADLPAVDSEARGSSDSCPPSIVGTETAEGVFPDTLGERVAVERTLDTDQPWPDAFEGARSLFAASEPMEEPPLAGYVFVREAMPEGSGYPFVAIGVRVEDGVPARLVYAFPGAYAAEPPVGLEDCTWFEGGRGWWLRFVDD